MHAAPMPGGWVKVSDPNEEDGPAHADLGLPDLPDGPDYPEFTLEEDRADFTFGARTVASVQEAKVQLACP